MNPKIYYHVSPHKLVGNLRPNRQGIHLASSLDIGKELFVNRGQDYDKAHKYKVFLKSELHPLFIDLDTMEWDAKNIAICLLGKLTNTEIPGSSEGEDAEGNTYKETNSPNLVHIDNLTFRDKEFLELLARKPNGSCGRHEFNMMANFLRKKGFDSIEYANWTESPDKGEHCYILFDSRNVDHYEEIE